MKDSNDQNVNMSIKHFHCKKKTKTKSKMPDKINTALTVTVAMNKTSVGGVSLSKLNATISHNTNKCFANGRKGTNAQHSEANYRFSHLEMSLSWFLQWNEVYKWHILWALEVKPPVLIIHWMWGCNLCGGKLSVHLGKPRSISTVTQITLHPCGPQQSTGTEQAVI